MRSLSLLVGTPIPVVVSKIFCLPYIYSIRRCQDNIPKKENLIFLWFLKNYVSIYSRWFLFIVFGGGKIN